MKTDAETHRRSRLDLGNLEVDEDAVSELLFGIHAQLGNDDVASLAADEVASLLAEPNDVERVSTPDELRPALVFADDSDTPVITLSHDEVELVDDELFDALFVEDPAAIAGPEAVPSQLGESPLGFGADDSAELGEDSDPFEPTSLRPTSWTTISIAPETSQRPRRMRALFPVGLAALALVVVGGVGVAAQQTPLRGVASLPAGPDLDVPEQTASPASDPAATTAPTQPSQLIVHVEPSDAYLQITEVVSGRGTRYHGPWPRTLLVEPGRYEAVAFRPGYRSAVQALHVEGAKAGAALKLRLNRRDGSDVYGDD